MKEAEASGRVALAQKLNDQMQKLEEQAAAFSIPNEFGATLSQAGAAGLNATTSHDATRYFMAMPANKLELWFALEAERFRVSHDCILLSDFHLYFCPVSVCGAICHKTMQAATT